MNLKIRKYNRIWISILQWVDSEADSDKIAQAGIKKVDWLRILPLILLHATLTINSLDHMFGTRRYRTDDSSRNNAILALISLGEGWHNHHYAVRARQRFY